MKRERSFADEFQVLDFAIEDNRLLANGRQIFPPIPPSPISAIQQLEDGELAGPMPVGYALEVMPVVSPSDEPGADLLSVRFTVLDLESHPVPVDTVAITLIQDAKGELYIARTEIEETTREPERLSWKKCEGKPKCLQELLVARVRGLLAAAKERVLGMASKAGRKGCGKHKGMMGVKGHHGPHKHNAHLVAGNAGRPHHPMHHFPGAFADTFSRVINFIVLPAILGVLAGLTASAIGMLVGQAVVFLWQRYRGIKPHEPKAAWEDGESCEKQGLMAEHSDEVLPEYVEEPSQRRGSLDKV